MSASRTRYAAPGWGSESSVTIREFQVPGAQEVLPRETHFQVVAGPPPQRGIHSHIRGDIRRRQARNISDSGVPLDIRAQIQNGTYLEMMLSGIARYRADDGITAARLGAERTCAGMNIPD